MNKKQVQKLYDLQQNGYQIIYTGNIYDEYGTEDDYENFTCEYWESVPVQCHIKKEKYQEGINFVFVFERGAYSKEVDFNNMPVNDISARKVIANYIHGENIKENGRLLNE